MGSTLDHIGLALNLKVFRFVTKKSDPKIFMMCMHIYFDKISEEDFGTLK